MPSIAGGAIASIAVSGLILLAPRTASATPLPGGCGDVRDVYTSGAEAHWTIGCTSGQISVTGWLKDTDADGQCAQTYAYFPLYGSTQYSRKVCGKGNSEEFWFSDEGTSANVYLREIG